jgi:subtilisin family serine protease
LPPGTQNVTLSLLQAAFSHNGLAHDFDKAGHDGAFRSLLSEQRASGPIIITHTKNDKAVGIAYPLASRISRDNATAMGDENDPYGGMGRNGAQHTSEVDPSLTTLEAVGFPYSFQTRKVYNLRADRFISDHSDVSGPQVVYAVLHAMQSIGEVPVDETLVGDRFANVTAPREIGNPEKRAKWGLPPLDQPNRPGQYIIELNAQHDGGLSAAANTFLNLCKDLIPDLMKQPPVGTDEIDYRPMRIAKSYYRCFLTDVQWRTLISSDEQNLPKQRAIYRLWPDFPVTAHTDHSIATIKADAAFRSFAASGAGIVWAVIDSGIQADHPHFGPTDDAHKNQHTLLADEVSGLHRCFANVYEEINGIPIDRGPLADPDLNPDLDRDQLVTKHRSYALKDDFGHGTHVAGIIAGKAPKDPNRRLVLERKYKVDIDGNRTTQSFEKREIDDEADLLRGVAPRCKLVSLRVLDQNGHGRASQVIQALEYVREHVNDNPKLLRVHGVNLSVGYEFDAEMFACGQSPLCAEVNRLVQEGVVVVAAAGNTGYGTVAASVGTSKVGLSNTINDPGNAELAITVGATHRDMPHLYGVSYFSSKGPTGDGRIKPDLVAPGERITSCAAGIKLKEAIKQNGNADNLAYYVDDSGTSMAAPHVSGAIAAFLSIRREFIGKPLEVKHIFLDSATPLGRERYFEGHGLVDVMRAIQSI